ncbi:MAG: methylenetetrahydrofolate reductase [NAD(P)H] [Planctomycetaceae bacterium]
MRIRDIYRQTKFGLSVEVFPPKTEQGDNALWATLEQLKRFSPRFVSCTYGAGGGMRNRTVEICQQIQKRFQLPATAHFTCVGSTRAELIEWLDYAVEHGVGNIMALRGDPPAGAESFKPIDGGLSYANELVTLIREHHPEIGIGVAGYPEVHPECSNLKTDIDNLKRKVDAGADAVFTQLFFENDTFHRFVDLCQTAGITVPIIPGVMPITEFARIKRIAALCGAQIPKVLADQLEDAKEDLSAQFEIGVQFAINQCRDLMLAGVPGMHLYVLNRSEACTRILDSLPLSS